MVTQSMIHHIQDEWLLSLEEKLQVVSLKSDRLDKRLKRLLAAVDFVRQKSVLEPPIGVSSEIKPKFWSRLRHKLALKRSK